MSADEAKEIEEISEVTLHLMTDDQFEEWIQKMDEMFPQRSRQSPRQWNGSPNFENPWRN